MGAGYVEQGEVCAFKEIWCFEEWAGLTGGTVAGFKVWRAEGRVLTCVYLKLTCGSDGRFLVPWDSNMDALLKPTADTGNGTFRRVVTVSRTHNQDEPYLVDLRDGF